MATSPLFGWEEPDDTDLVKDGAAAIRTLGNAIDTSMGDLLGGTSGQVLSKNSNTNMDFTWVTSDDANAIQNAIVDAKGDLITATAADTPARLAVGTNGQILTADSTAATGIKWVDPAGGGKILQVVNASTTTSTLIATSSLTDTTITATITPTSATSKIMVLITGVTETSRSAQNNGYILSLVRGATTIETWDWYAYYNLIGVTSVSNFGHSFTVEYMDSPASTSALTYKLQGATIFTANSGQTRFQPSSVKSTIILMEVGA
jgi:hypothetical protein